LILMEPHPATIEAAIRMESNPAVQRTVFTVKPWQANFERVFSGLQTLPRWNAQPEQGFPAKVSPRSAFLC
jgi:hypothetical protein